MVKLALSAVALSPLLAIGRAVAVPVEDVIGRDLSTETIDKSTDVQANSSLDIRDAAFKNTCYHPSTDVSVGTIGGAVACSKFLKGLDTRQCHAKRGGLVLCEEKGTVSTLRLGSIGWWNTALPAKGMTAKLPVCCSSVLDHIMLQLVLYAA
ncbi:hypothetical protein CIRG_00188 [Coccidioides immitis RMSCC 2394]|uniref:Cyanovirin-N domain-containing protein n=1 Tax=Coccidioides immitis RMSCC 2394 TaxID=404692 RepID=A0A0J6XV75_COCIT|nr:hypothetical protein CIRG_00188 [Coccidioides immitis RMSCC 2394]